MNPFEAARDVAGLWERGGDAYLRAQTDLLSGMASWLAGGPARSGEAPAVPRSDPPPPLPAEPEAARPILDGSPALAGPHALAGAHAFDRSWATAQDVAATALAHLAERDIGRDDASRAALARIFDPAAWFAGLEERNGASPVFPPDGRTDAVLAAWAGLRHRNLDHAAIMLEAWMQAAGFFAREVSRDPAPDLTAEGLTERWAALAGRTLDETRRSDAFAAAQRGLLEAAATLRAAQAELGLQTAEVYGLPTRAEMEALGQTVAELRREVRSLQRALRLERGRDGERGKR